MTVAELIIKLSIKASGAEKLKQTDDALKRAASSAKEAAKSITAVAAAVEDAGQMKFGFDTPAGHQIGFFFDKEKLQGLPPVLDRVAEKEAKVSLGTRLMSRDFKELQSWVDRTAIKLDVLAAGMLYLVDTAMRGARQLVNFGFGTGLDILGLQKAQGAGARVGITPQEMAAFVTSLQSAGASMSMTGAGVGPWSLLAAMYGIKGVNFKDPVALVNQLHVAIMKLRPDQMAQARLLFGNVGVSADMFARLANPEFRASHFKEMFAAIKAHSGDMNKLNSEWSDLETGISATKNALIADLSPALTVIVELLARAVHWVSTFVELLDRDSAGAKIAKIALVGLGVGITVLAGSFTFMAGAMSIAAIAAGALDLALLPILGTAAAIAAAVGIAIGSLVAMGVISEDLDDQYHGKKGFIPKKYRPAVRIGLGVLETVEGLPASGAKDFFQGIRELFTNPAKTSIGGSSINQTNHYAINEAGDPQRSAAVVRDVNQGIFNAAAYAAGVNVV